MEVSPVRPVLIENPSAKTVPDLRMLGTTLPVGEIAFTVPLEESTMIAPASFASIF
jgi:hypothetical protein